MALVFTQWGEAFGLYDALPWYDRVVHVIVPLLSSQVIADAFGAPCGGALMVRGRGGDGAACGGSPA